MSSALLASIQAGFPSHAPDRRTSERKVCRVSGLLHVQGHTPLHVKTLDLSTKGVALLLPRALPNKTVCDLYFQLHLEGMLRQFAAKIEIANTVFLRSDVRAGCHFLSLDERSRTVLADFMR